MRDDRRVLRVHPGHGGDAERSGDTAGQRAAQAIAARVEGGARDHEIRLEALQRLTYRGAGVVLALRDVVVAADERGHDRASAAERLLDRASRSHRPLAHLERRSRPLLASDPAEELIQVMDHTDWVRHDPAALPSLPRRSTPRR